MLFWRKEELIWPNFVEYLRRIHSREREYDIVVYAEQETEVEDGQDALENAMYAMVMNMPHVPWSQLFLVLEGLRHILDQRWMGWSTDGLS